MAARILVVEDNPANLSLMEYLLRAFGYAVVTATDGAAGVDAARRESPDVILMDLQMPVLNGYECAERMRAVPALRAVPIVAVTAFAMVGDRDKILARGFDGYISKPITPDTFVGQVEAFVPASLRSSGHPAGADAPEPPAPLARGQTILVVDNSPVNLSLTASTLGPLGYDVVTAGSVGEAVEILRTRRPDLILSDIHMPGQSGYDFIALVKADARLRNIPFVFISSTVWRDRDRAAGLGFGARDFILRPIEPEAFVARIEASLRDRER